MLRHLMWIRWLCFALVASSAQAQAPSVSPREIGEIINAALQEVIPPEKDLSSRTVAQRGIRFDYGRTLAAFRLVDNAEARAHLGLNRPVTEGSRALLDDCDQMGMKPCERLGRSVYVFVEPISLSDSAAAVWVHVEWVTTPSKRSFLSFSATEVFLERSGSGPWRFVRTGRVVIS